MMSYVVSLILREELLLWKKQFVRFLAENIQKWTQWEDIVIETVSVLLCILNKIDKQKIKVSMLTELLFTT